MLINLWEKEVTGGRSGLVGRTIRKYNSFLSREVAALFGLEGHTADGPPLRCGQSACVLKKSSREVVSLAWAERLYCGRSGPGARTVRRSLKNLTRDDFTSGGLHDVKGGWSAQGVRTVRTSNFKFVQRRCLSECSECLNGGRSANRARMVRQ